MDAQELRNLQEAYMEVYDEGYKDLPVGKMIRKSAKHGIRMAVASVGNDEKGFRTSQRRAVKMSDVADTHSKEASIAKSKLKKEEAHLEIYGEGRVAWDDKKNPNPSGYTPKEKAKAKVKQLIGDLDKTPSDTEYQRAGNIISKSDEKDRGREKPTHKYEKLGKKALIGQDRNQTRGQSTREARRKMGHEYALSRVPKEKQKYYPTEQIDLYNIILSHLLDEGYAETPEAAEAIMVNMSEEWRNSIFG